MSIHRGRLAMTVGVGIACVMGGLVACNSSSEPTGHAAAATTSPALPTTRAAEVKPVDDWTAFAKTIKPFRKTTAFRAMGKRIRRRGFG